MYVHVNMVLRSKYGFTYGYDTDSKGPALQATWGRGGQCVCVCVKEDNKREECERRFCVCVCVCVCVCANG